MNTSPANTQSTWLISVTPNDKAIAPIEKLSAHEGNGVLHRAFSIFLFDPAGRLLLQQRSAQKPLWPGWWANSCCSHPRWGQELQEAVMRRVPEELGAPLVEAPRWHFHFTYQARWSDIGSENELCHVFTGRLASPPQPNPDEVADVKWVTPVELEKALADPTAPFTPWLRIEWPKLAPMLAQTA
ncbi:isopentenyl-diphosphate Delta-isomerase [Neorhizobium sp. NCHU2750]|uniref:isopentenyl-diphosphate Delta-isomerase n=1 Tax=Neorhizobium sp. NCHU2750 TaxID=1825976 RepID=UPI000E73A08C